MQQWEWSWKSCSNKNPTWKCHLFTCQCIWSQIISPITLQFELVTFDIFNLHFISALWVTLSQKCTSDTFIQSITQQTDTCWPWHQRAILNDELIMSVSLWIVWWNHTKGVLLMKHCLPSYSSAQTQSGWWILKANIMCWRHNALSNTDIWWLNGATAPGYWNTLQYCDIRVTQGIKLPAYTDKITARVRVIWIYVAINTLNFKTMLSFQMEDWICVVKYWHLVARLNMTSSSVLDLRSNIAGNCRTGG